MAGKPAKRSKHGATESSSMTTAGIKKRLVVALSLSLTAGIVGGCASRAPAGDNAWCLTNKPLRPTAEDYERFSIEQKIEMDAHNSFGEKWCGWRP